MCVCLRPSREEDGSREERGVIKSILLFRKPDIHNCTNLLGENLERRFVSQFRKRSYKRRLKHPPRLNLAKVNVARLLRVLLRLHLALEEAVAVYALEGELVHVRVLAGRFGFLG